MFDTQFDKRGRFYTSFGNPVVETYTGRYDKNGDLQLLKTGTENLYDKIQAEAAACDMDNILRRFANGDISVLSQSQGIYADVSGAPMHFTDALNMVRSVEEAFNQMSSDDREKYDNDWVKYGASLVNSSFEPSVEPSVELPVEPVVEKEVAAE